MNIYIDLGANLGLTLREFATHNPEYVLYAVEPQRELFPSILDSCRDLGRPVSLIWGAAWIRNGEMNMFESDHSAAATVVQGKAENLDAGWSPIDYSKAVPVPCIDFSNFLRSIVRPDDYVICKMDIEGAEYPVLSKMMFDGTLALVDELRCEWHWDRLPHITQDEHDSLVEAVSQRTNLVDWD